MRCPVEEEEIADYPVLLRGRWVDAGGVVQITAGSRVEEEKISDYRVLAQFCSIAIYSSHEGQWRVRRRRGRRVETGRLKQVRVR